MVISNANIAKANKIEENNFSAKDNYVRANNFIQESKKFNFSKEDTNKLVEKIRKGEKLDSEKKNEKPIKEYEYLEGVNRNRVEKFRDGSYIVTSWPDEEVIMKKINAKSNGDRLLPTEVVTGGVVVSKDSQHTSFEGGKVSRSLGIMSTSFKIDYTTFRDHMSTIDSVYSPEMGGLGNNSFISLKILQKTATTSKPAKAEMSYSIDLKGFYSGTEYLGATVGNNKGKGGLRAY